MGSKRFVVVAPTPNTWFCNKIHFTCNSLQTSVSNHDLKLKGSYGCHPLFLPWSHATLQWTSCDTHLLICDAHQSQVLAVQPKPMLLTLKWNYKGLADVMHGSSLVLVWHGDGLHVTYILPKRNWSMATWTLAMGVVVG